MNSSSDLNKSKVSINKFIPFYLLEIVITFTSGILGTAVSNHLIAELKYEPWIGGFIVSMASAGFMFCTLLFGHVSDKYGQRKVICLVLILRFAFSFFYLIPITSIQYLIIFGVIMFLDGGVSGMFWPTIQQISVHAEKHGGLDLKQKYMSGYNFSWNFGFISGMITGAIFVYNFNSNYITFYLNTFGLIIGVLIALFLVDNVSDIFEINSGENLISNKFSTVIKEPEILENEENELTTRFQEIPLYSILVILLIHSLTDGLITIFSTMKIDVLNQGLYWVFILTLMKLCSQMISTIIFSLTKEDMIIKGIILAVLTVIISWFLIALSNDLLTLGLLFIASGIGQGAIYAFVMKLVVHKARMQKSSRAFAFFQTMMSSGRMLGAIIFGFTATISLSLGLYILIIFDLISLIQFFLITKYLVSKE